MQHSLNEDRLNYMSHKFNRSKGQTLFLFQLVDGDFEKLKELELKIKNCHVAYCPGDKEEVAKIMAMEQKSNWFKL